MPGGQADAPRVGRRSSRRPTKRAARTPTRGAQITRGQRRRRDRRARPGLRPVDGGGGGVGVAARRRRFLLSRLHLMQMVERIRANWNQQAERRGPGDREVHDPARRHASATSSLERSSGYPSLDLDAQRAVVVTRQLPPLPAAFPNPTLTVHLNFRVHDDDTDHDHAARSVALPRRRLPSRWPS